MSMSTNTSRWNMNILMFMTNIIATSIRHPIPLGSRTRIGICTHRYAHAHFPDLHHHHRH